VLLTSNDRIEIPGVMTLYFHQRHGDKLNSPGYDDTTFQKERRNLTTDYVISDRILGMGAYGRVYMAWDTKEHKQVACKVVDLVASNASPRAYKSRDAHMKEVEILASMNHVSILFSDCRL
jgi:serine/threonine protein kinase